MKVSEFKKLLSEKPSYLKKGRQWLSDNFDISLEDIEKAIFEIKQKNPQVVKSRSKLSYFKDIMLPKLDEEIETRPMKWFESSKPKKRSENNVLVIGDLHEPFTLDGYLEHCLKVKEDFNCNEILFIGDLVDNHAVSYHEHDPSGKSPYDEYLLSIEKLQEWYKAFPKAKVCIGNHDELPVRRVFSTGLPKFWLKSLEQILQAPSSYEFGLHHVIDDVFYTHGTGLSGDGAAMKIADKNRQSAVIGHLHSVSNIKYSASYKDIIFGMTVGCGIDYKQYAFNYGRDLPNKPIISCGVVIGGKVPVIVPMEL